MRTHHATGTPWSASLSLADLEAHDPQAPSGNGHRRFCCPAPACADKPISDGHRSLSLDTSSGLWKCHRCDARGKLVDHGASGIRPRPRPSKPIPKAPQAKKPASTAPLRLVCTYEIRDFDGTLLARRPRQEGADHGTRDVDGHKISNKAVAWHWVRGGKRPTTDLLYGAETLAALPTGTRLALVEGEKARDALVARGQPAVALVCGASATPSARVLDHLSRFAVVLWPDADQHGKGQALMRRVAAGLLERRGQIPRWVALADAEDAADAADYPGTDAELEMVLENAPSAYTVLVAQLQADHAAALQATTAQVQTAETRTARIERDYHAVLNAQANKAVRHVAPTAVALASEVLSAISRGADPTQPVRLYLPDIGARIGVTATQVSTQLGKLADWGIIDKRTFRTLTINRDGRPGVRKRVEVFVPALRDGGTVATLLEPLATFTPPDVLSGAQLLQGQHRRCPDHPQAAVIRRWTDICAECGQVVDEGEYKALAATAISERAPDAGSTQVTCVDKPTRRSAARARALLLNTQVTWVEQPPTPDPSTQVTWVEPDDADALDDPDVWAVIASAPATTPDAAPASTQVTWVEPALPTGFTHWCPTCPPGTWRPLTAKAVRCSRCAPSCPRPT